MRLLYLIKKEFLELFRQKELMPLIFIAPIIQVILLGYVVTTDVENIPVTIIDLAQNQSSTHIVRRICSTPLFNVKNIYNEPQNTLEILKKGDSKSIIIFRDSKKTKKFPEIQILMDGVNSNTSAIAAGYFNGIIKKYLVENLEKNGMEMPVEANTLIRFNPELESINFMGPGIVALMLTVLALFFTSVSIVREKEQQTMDTILISRLTPLEIYIGKALPFGVVGIINMLYGLALVILWFNIPIKGNLAYMFLASIIFLTALLSYALLISTLSATIQQALFFSWFSMMVFILLSGLFTPVANIPVGLKFLADINPVRYLIEIIREIFLKGNGIEYFYKDLLSLATISLVVLSISLLTFRRFISK